MTSDEQVLQLAYERDSVLITCNRDDFVALLDRVRHNGIIILIRRRSPVVHPRPGVDARSV